MDYYFYNHLKKSMIHRLAVDSPKHHSEKPPPKPAAQPPPYAWQISTACGAGLVSCAISVGCNTPKAGVNCLENPWDIWENLWNIWENLWKSHGEIHGKYMGHISNLWERKLGFLFEPVHGILKDFLGVLLP